MYDFWAKPMVLHAPMALLRALILSLLFSLSAACAADENGKPPRIHRTAIYTELGIDDCLRCHSGEKMRAVLASPHLDSARPGTPGAGYGCEDCHGPGSIHISRAHGGQGFPPLTVFGRGSDTAPREEQLHACLACHALDGQGGEAIGFVGSPHDRRTINCSTCHTLHAGSDPINDKEHQAKTCNRCHRRHMENHPRFEDKSIDFDALACATCHDVHAAVEELE